ncbi:unknown [Ruminococcus sp. CAG:330]|nr:unknown [Ruminococcus sp. CAG:330]
MDPHLYDRTDYSVLSEKSGHRHLSSSELCFGCSGACRRMHQRIPQGRKVLPDQRQTGSCLLPHQNQSYFIQSTPLNGNLHGRIQGGIPPLSRRRSRKGRRIFQSVHRTSAVHHFRGTVSEYPGAKSYSGGETADALTGTAPGERQLSTNAPVWFRRGQDSCTFPGGICRDAAGAFSI